MTNQPGPIRSLATYSLLGRSGLRVSPLCLGTMTFGTDWGWGAPKDTAHALLRRYFEAGGNFVDTAEIAQAVEAHPAAAGLQAGHRRGSIA